MREFLNLDEQIIQSTPGTIDISTLNVLWRLGNLHLTNKRVLFEHQGRIQFATFLEDIVDVKLEMRKWILQHIRQLCILTRNSYTKIDLGKPGRAYIAVRSPVGWQKAIKNRMTLALLEGYYPSRPDPERSEGERSKGFGDSSVASLPQNDKKRMAQSLQQGQ